MDWREVGCEVCEYVKATELKKEKELDRISAQLKADRTRENKVFGAIVQAAAGDIEWLIELLSSDEDFAITSRKTREHLVKVLRTGILRRSKRGRRTNTTAQITCRRAVAIFQLWKLANREMGIADWGVRGKMKDEAAQYAIDFFREKMHRLFPGERFRDPDFETVRQLMNRPLSRRGIKRRQNKG